MKTWIQFLELQEPNHEDQHKVDMELFEKLFEKLEQAKNEANKAVRTLEPLLDQFEQGTNEWQEMAAGINLVRDSRRLSHEAILELREIHPDVDGYVNQYNKHR